MTKTDYEVLADVFKGLVKNPNIDWISVNQIDGLVDIFCERLKICNPRFSSEKFRKACGLDDPNPLCPICHKESCQTGPF